MICIFICVPMLIVSADKKDDDNRKTDKKVFGVFPEIKEFNELDGDAEYLGINYINKYSLDIEETGMFDVPQTIFNQLANMLFDAIKSIAYIVVSIFYYAMTFDIAQLLSKQLNGIMSGLNAGIFKPLFNLGFAFTSIILIKQLLKRDLMGAYTEILKVIGIILLSFLIVNKSGEMLSATTNITKSVSVEALTNVNSEMGINKMESFGATAAGTLWVNLVHNMWCSMEFGDTNYKDSDVKKFLDTQPNGEERKKCVKEYSESLPRDGKDNIINDCFNKNRGVERIGFLIVYLIPFLLKSGIYLAVAAIELAFQVLAVFYMLLAPVMLILAMFPSYGTQLLGAWFRKILETQIAILIVSFVIALLVKIDAVLYELTPQWGWFIVLITQTAVSVLLFMKRKEVMKAFTGLMTNVQRGVMNPAYARSRMVQSGNLYESMSNLEKKHLLQKGWKQLQKVEVPKIKMFEPIFASKPDVERQGFERQTPERKRPTIKETLEKGGLWQNSTEPASASSAAGVNNVKTETNNTKVATNDIKTAEKTTVEKTKEKKIRMNLGTEEVEETEKVKLKKGPANSAAVIEQRTARLRKMQGKDKLKERPKMVIIDRESDKTKPNAVTETQTGTHIQAEKEVNRPSTMKVKGGTEKVAQNGNNEVREAPVVDVNAPAKRNSNSRTTSSYRRTTVYDSKVYCPKMKKKTTLRSCKNCKHQENLMCLYR